MFLKQKESDIVKLLLQYLELMGFLAFRINAGMIFIESKAVKLAPKGVSDIIAIDKRNGKFIAIEAKTPERIKKLSTAQRNFLSQVRMSGGTAFVACSIDDVKKNLKI